MNINQLDKYFKFREVLLTWSIADLWSGLEYRIESRQAHIAACEACSDDLNALCSRFDEARCRRLKALSTVIDLFTHVIDLKMGFDPE